MKKLKLAIQSLCAVTFVAFAIGANAQNIVKDPGFELSPGPTPPVNPSDYATGGFSSSWVLTPPAGNGAGQQLSNVGTSASLAHSGTHYANLEYSQPPPNSTASLSQVLNTVAGQVYTLSFWLVNFTSQPVNSFQVFFGGVAVTAVITSPPFPVSGTPPQWQQLTATGLMATGSTTTLEFRYRNDNDYWGLDDVSVSAPEGGIPLVVVATILGGICVAGSRMRRVQT
jgi:hypothetical protein